LIISAGIREVYYETPFVTGDSIFVRDSFVNDGLVKLKQIKLSAAIAQRATSLILNPTSIACSKEAES
jgi:dCMP deaminase